MARSGQETREGIRAAAVQLFLERGYAGTSVRDIAGRAQADPALVIRHFGSKEQLFLDAMQVEFDDDPLLSAPLETLGESFIAYVLTHDELRGVFLALLRASDGSGIGSRLKDIHETAFIGPLRRRLGGPDAELRARLAAALVGGLLYALWVVG
ncbi:MAG TPA: TetR family transcriptional regulator, partial [Naasia sp.]